MSIFEHTTRIAKIVEYGKIKLTSDSTRWLHPRGLIGYFCRWVLFFIWGICCVRGKTRHYVDGECAGIQDRQGFYGVRSIVSDYCWHDGCGSGKNPCWMLVCLRRLLCSGRESWTDLLIRVMGVDGNRPPDGKEFFERFWKKKTCNWWIVSRCLRPGRRYLAAGIAR